MNAAAIIALLEQLIPEGISLYKELAANVGSSQTVEQVLAQADANWDAVIAAAKAQVPPPPAT